MALLVAVCSIAMVSCGRDITAPVAGDARMARGLSFNAVFPALFQQAGSFAAGLVQYDRVRVVVRHSDATTAIDTIYAFGAGSDSVVVSLNVPLLASAPDSGEALRLSLYYLSSAGDTMFKGGPATVIARGDAAGRNSKPVTVPVSYSGPGANAALVVISPRSLAVPAGDNFALTANARDSTGHTIPRTPIFWTSLDPARVTIASPTTGGGIATGQRGTARVVAQLVNGLADTVTIQIEPQPSAISTQSGDGQGGVVNAMLAQPLVARVVGGDGLGVEGALVSFFLRAGGGTLARRHDGRNRRKWPRADVMAPGRAGRGAERGCQRSRRQHIGDVRRNRRRRSPGAPGRDSRAGVRGGRRRDCSSHFHGAGRGGKRRDCVHRSGDDRAW
jgi:hypothetical protein